MTINKVTDDILSNSITAHDFYQSTLGRKQTGLGILDNYDPQLADQIIKAEDHLILDTLESRFYKGYQNPSQPDPNLFN
jgi:hypothetical protein